MRYPLNDQKKDWLNFSLCGLLLFFLGFIVLGVRYVYTNKENFDLAPKEEKAVDEALVSPTPTAALESTTKYTVKVINSTGVKGLAAATVENLKNKGLDINSSLGNGEERKGSKLIFKTEEMKKTKLGVSIILEFSSASVSVDSSLSYDLVIDLGK